jgi:hypothetical protein
LGETYGEGLGPPPPPPPQEEELDHIQIDDWDDDSRGRGASQSIARDQEASTRTGNHPEKAGCNVARRSS